ncbi:MAG TPA: tetratricopeptide repeat protein, partial [Pyrinomonadaceae bacterium]|nr:tetratricopeptide repeat protein [Pyrinomonadaceae bacterium]
MKGRGLAGRECRIMQFLRATLLGLLCATAVKAQDAEQHQHELGKVNFTISCSASAQKLFNYAVAWLHSFEYDEAEKRFKQVTTTDQKCGMGYWGIAMSHYHPIWAPPTSADLQKGEAAAVRATSLGARTKREGDYIAAIAVFYKDANKLDHRARAFAYWEAMKRLYQRYPKDREAAVFYALTLIARGMMANDKSYANEKKAAEILTRVLAAEPEHPGVAHYLIHSYDFPSLAVLALPAARSYAKIAVASAHAQHMPSHIFTRLGLWQEAIQSNLDAVASAKAYAIRNQLKGAWDEQLHALDYLAYAYLQSGQDKQARLVFEDLNRIQQAEPENFKVAYAFSAIPARYALERRRWSEAVSLSLSPAWFPWHHFPWAEAHLHFARAVGAARSGEVAMARQEVEQLAAIRQGLSEIKGDYDWARQVEIHRRAAAAWLAFAEGKRGEALQLMRAAAELDDSTDKHPVSPGSLIPAREQLADLLLELNRPADALHEFETSLRNTPNRFNGIYGAAMAALELGDETKAKTYFSELVKLCPLADGDRIELTQAK